MRAVSATIDPSTKKQTSNQDTYLSNCMRQYLACTLLAASCTCLIYIYYTCPGSQEIVTALRVPRNVGDAKQLGAVILKYKNQHYYSVIAAYLSAYILLQSLCIPGSIVLSILAGYLFPAPLALLIICTCSTLGASTFYILVNKRRDSVFRLLGGERSNSRLAKFRAYVREKIGQYRSNLFLCVFILRATPIFPNWTINLCSPLIDLPFRPFVLGTFAGIAPLSTIHVWTGGILNDLSNEQSLINWQSVLMTSLVAVSIALLVYIRRLG